MEISLIGKHALVGGSSKGIGEGIARELARCGASVTVMGRSEGKLQILVNELDSSNGQEHHYLTTDMMHLERYKNDILEHLKKYPVDILVNNTPGPPPGFVGELRDEDYAKAFDLLFRTINFTTQAVTEHMKSTGFGRIINVTSVTIKEPKPELVLSNTIRASIITWAKSLSQELGPFGITVNSILTGYFDTERLEEVNRKKAERSGKSMDELQAEMAAQNSLNRIGQPEEYGYLVCFLASDKAAYLTGTAIPLDGGYLRSV
ncbi:SDR family oxidoreductase [Robertkochia marina]|uniref:SDR family oxidoreductase n=1 Tax=Robertkochia marina TaxID=1227945 RepID=A0A4S3M073_9FLAO|nr:SDR family oxidoreductase [Robertkochia marina]THD66303.1 SDR family oxidoreductase [Robertkochia marina]TRZ41223.1 SDR family oxidoreductase [Robertkochia marina]